MSETWTQARIGERGDFPAITAPKPKRQALPGPRKVREPDAPCRVCGRPATRTKGTGTPLCALHYKAVLDIVNQGRTDGVATVVEAETPGGSLRQRLKAKCAPTWPDRPLTQFVPTAAD